MSDTSGTFGDWKERITYVVAEAQLLVFAVLFSLGVAILWIQPSVPGIPPVVFGWFAALILLGPPLIAIFVTGARKLRDRRMTTVYHINGVDDVRKKYYVEPELWSQKTVEGPSPYVYNDGDAFEVREFTHHEDIGELVVRGCYMSQMADSKLVTTKTMLEDIHGDLVEAFLELNQLRGRISKMGLQIQGDVINEEAEADERGLMNPRTAVKDRFESAKEDAAASDDDEIRDVGQYVDEYTEGHGPRTPVRAEESATEQATATDGGHES